MGRIARPRAQRIRHAVGTGGAEGAGRASVMKRLQGRALHEQVELLPTDASDFRSTQGSMSTFFDESARLPRQKTSEQSNNDGYTFLQPSLSLHG